MIRSVLNPPDVESDYLVWLNQCFVDWGDAKTFAWCFRRPVCGRVPDLMVLRDGDAVLAGSGLTYRRVSMPNGSMLIVACMTGSWTLPAARRRGCFARIIDASLDLARERGCDLLLAYVTCSNPSCRQLTAAGARLLPSAYLVGAPKVPATAPACAIEALAIGEPWRERTLACDAAQYWYEPSEWNGQFVERPARVIGLAVDGSSLAVVEAGNEFDRVLQLNSPNLAAYVAALQALRARSGMAGRKLFTFSVAPAVIRALEASGFAVTPGYVAALPVRRDTLAVLGPSWPHGAWWIENGDRM
jgi:GNAT superfamily N-acetyltransferase